MPENNQTVKLVHSQKKLAPNIAAINKEYLLGLIGRTNENNINKHNAEYVPIIQSPNMGK